MSTLFNVERLQIVFFVLTFIPSLLEHLNNINGTKRNSTQLRPKTRNALPQKKKKKRFHCEKWGRLFFIRPMMRYMGDFRLGYLCSTFCNAVLENDCIISQFVISNYIYWAKITANKGKMDLKRYFIRAISQKFWKSGLYKWLVMNIYNIAYK